MHIPGPISTWIPKDLAGIQKKGDNFNKLNQSLWNITGTTKVHGACLPFYDEGLNMTIIAKLACRRISDASPLVRPSAGIALRQIQVDSSK